MSVGLKTGSNSNRNLNIGDRITGAPAPSQGSNGDLQLRLDDAPKIFCKISDVWYENVLFERGEGIFSGNIGLEIKHKSKSVASFGKKIRLGRKQNDTGRLELDNKGNINFINRQGATDGNVFSIKTNGETQIDTRATDADVPLRITNDGTGYNQVVMGGANPELRMGYAGSGASVSSSVAGSSKIYLNHGGSVDNMASIHFARSGSSKFAFGNTYESSTDELRLVHGDDPRTEANAALRIDTSGNIGFRGAAPAAAPNYTYVNLSLDRVLDCDSTSTAELADILGTLIKDLIDMGILQ